MFSARGKRGELCTRQLGLGEGSGAKCQEESADYSCLIKNIQSRGFLPTINSVIDIYNVECLRSFLAIGGKHDLDKMQGPIEFTISQERDTFCLSYQQKSMLVKPIRSTEINRALGPG